MPSKNTPVEAKYETIPFTQHHFDIAEAYSLGSDCVNRLRIMVIAARALAKESTHPGVTPFVERLPR